MALRVAYRAELAKIALIDVCSPDPVELMPTIGRYLADLAAAALEGALAIARTEVAEGAGGGCAPPRAWRIRGCPGSGDYWHGQVRGT